MNIRTDSTEYVRSTVTIDHDLASATIDVALPVSGQTPTEWFPAEITGTTTSAGKWTATYRLLVGPDGGATELIPGSYDWTVRVNDIVETPVRKAGVVIATAS
jgi:hypothetical protein